MILLPAVSLVVILLLLKSCFKMLQWNSNIILIAALIQVEGLQEFLKECESRAPGSPLMSGITSSRARQSRTTVKITREEPQSCKMITKSCRGSRKRTVDEPKNDVTKTPAAQSAQQKATPAASALSENESIQEKEDNAVQSENSSMDASQVSGGSEFNGDISNCKCLILC